MGDTLIYLPLCHMVWGNGRISSTGRWAEGSSVLDFAGGTVVHISSGRVGAGVRFDDRQSAIGFRANPWSRTTW